MYFGLVRGLLRYTLVHGFFRGGLGLFGGGVAIIWDWLKVDLGFL